MNYNNLDNFKENNFIWPLHLSIENEGLDPSKFSDQYFNFQEEAKKKLGYEVSLKPNLLSKFFDKLCFNKNIINNVKKLIGNDIYVWSSALFPKAPNEGKIVSFHQDNPYWQLSTNKVVTAWIALTTSDEFSGALQVVPGSAKKGLIKKIDVENARESYLKGKKTTIQSDMLSYNQNLDDYMKKNPPVTLTMKPGEYSIHHIDTVHGSGVNNSKNYRIGFAIRYISSDTTHLIETHKDFAIHVSGEKNNYFVEEARPKDDFGKTEIAQHELSMSSAGAFGNKKYVS